MDLPEKSRIGAAVVVVVAESIVTDLLEWAEKFGMLCQ